LAEYVQKNEGYFKPKQSSSFFGTWFKSFYWFHFFFSLFFF
jgi:hypothetical protein